jgi:ABC-2 type transport system permease protein
VNQITAIAGRVLVELTRTRRTLVFWVVFPTLMLILFGMIYAGQGESARSFDETAPGILVGAALFFSCLGGPTAVVVAERERHTLRRLLTSSLHPVAYFLGIVLAHLVIALGQAVIVYGIAWLFGGRFHGSLALGLLILLLSVISYVGLGFFFGTTLTRRTEDVNGPVAAFGVPLLVLGGTFFPVSILPPTLLSLAWMNPIFHMIEALKGVSARARGWSAIAPHIVILVIFAIVSVLMGARSYRRMLMNERRA